MFLGVFLPPAYQCETIGKNVFHVTHMLVRVFLCSCVFNIKSRDPLVKALLHRASDGQKLHKVSSTVPQNLPAIM